MGEKYANRQDAGSAEIFWTADDADDSRNEDSRLKMEVGREASWSAVAMTPLLPF
jgi:hypothetical protein